MNTLISRNILEFLLRKMQDVDSPIQVIHHGCREEFYVPYLALALGLGFGG